MMNRMEQLGVLGPMNWALKAASMPFLSHSLMLALQTAA